MPRAAAANSCNTCLTRKVKCDTALPICKRCDRRGLFCDRSSPLLIKRYKQWTDDTTSAEADPRILLQNMEIARLFHIYIKELAPWYDLNDCDRHSFGNLVPTLALDNPLLFAAIIAFAGIYASRKHNAPAVVTEAYHSRCLHLLIALSPRDKTIADGVVLAALCLLRSYEVLSEQEDPNRHLFGASTLVPTIPRLSDRGLLSCAFWNYLREDITYSLLHECPLKIEVRPVTAEPESDDEFANHITLLLAALINSYFGNTPINVLSELQHWRRRFSATPFSKYDDGGPFPSIKMLKDCHVAAMHYYHIAMCMVDPNVQESSAIEICGLAMSAESDAVIVNAYGPICFSSRWIKSDMQRQALVLWLRHTGKRTAWMVETLIPNLLKSWTNETVSNSTSL